MKDIPYLMLEDIDFTTAEKKVESTKKDAANSATPIASTVDYKPPNDEEQVFF